MRDLYPLFEPVSVRWGDMDAMGHVNNATYFTYCESARMRFFDRVGMEAHCADGQYGPAVVSATCNFYRQVHYPAQLEVGVRVSKLGKSSFTLEYALLRAENEEMVADGSSVVVWVDYHAGKSLPLPEELRRALEERGTLPT